MKKIVIAILTVVMALSLFACATPAAAPSESASAPAEASSAAPAQSESAAPAQSAAAGTEVVGGDHAALKDLKTDFKIVTIPKTTGIAWFQRMDLGVKQFAADTGVDAYQDGPATADAAEQAKYVEDAIAAKVDAICVVPFSTEALEPVLKKARDAGILVISHEADGMTNIDYDLEAFDNTAYGEHFMTKLAELTDKQGEYAVMVGALTSQTHNTWVDASVALQQKDYPDMKLAGDKVESADDQEQAYTKTKEVLTAYPELKGFQGSAMADVAGAARAVEEAGMTGKVKIVGTSLVSVSGKYIKDGVIDMISFWDPAAAGYAMNELALRILNGEKVENGMNLTVQGYENLSLGGANSNTLYAKAWIDVDKSNVDDPLYQF